MWTRPRAARGVALVALAVAGCGGGASSGGSGAAQQIRSTLTTYYTAFAQGDGARACDQLSSTTRAALQESAHGKSCAAAVSEVAKQPAFAALRKRIARAHISAIDASGGEGSATVTLGSTSVQVTLVIESGAWKISSTGSGSG